MATIVKSPLAGKDFADIFHYLAEATTVGHAQKFLRLIEEKCELLAKFPEMGRTRHEFIVDLRSFPVKNYIVFYLPVEDGIEILRFFHASRDIAEIFDEMIDETKKVN